MFFVSEEFLRKYEAGEKIEQTIDEAVLPGHELFEETGGRRCRKEVKPEESPDL